jgi:hypothetical protein
MSCIRIIDSQFASATFLSTVELRKLKNFIWRDPVLDETLRALTICRTICRNVQPTAQRNICPLIAAYRNRLDNP